ncbi:BCCT family transporter [Bartonella tamiae]|uniref:BCCT family transporter n=1 Tax=Bartonella tamiae TaxID=373638 RepID=UPI00026E73F0|nr:BCCT family transporter [Bartonella tamiae]EJF93780.1 betaine/carnitine/choline transporter (BCCT) family transporter [Bartonella tamiae Th307]
MKFHLIDKITFWGSVALLLLVTMPLIFYPEAGEQWINQAKAILTDEFGFIYLALGLAAFCFMIYIIFSDIGQIKLGEPDEDVEFGTLSWGAMLFCGGIGASILYWGTIEWAYYYIQPPFNAIPESHEAVRWATTYGLFHWGFIAWSIYLVPALPIAYFYYVRKKEVLKVSVSLMPVIGEKKSKGLTGKLIDVMFVFGMLGGGATTLGISAPLITEGLHVLFGFPTTLLAQLGVLLICTCIFAYSSYAGMEKGIKFFSNINFWGAMGFLAFVLIVGPTVFLLNTGLDAIGRMLTNFFRMATWTEPFGGLSDFDDTHFPQDWTIFYWAWWLVFAPSMGLFIARISRGRTMKQMVAGSLFFGSLGCFLFFIVLGNYSLSLQLSGALDVIQILKDQGPTSAIYATLGQLPFSYLAILVFTILCVIFTATTFDSISYILAAVVQKKINKEPMRWNRLFWAFALSFLPATLLFMGGLSTLQTAAIVGGLPLLFIVALQMVSIVKAANFDLRNQEEYSDPVINITETDEIDPWSTEGIALAKFEQLRDEAQEASENERLANNDLFAVRKKIRSLALQWDADVAEHKIPDELLEEQKRATDALKEARTTKETASKAAQQARMEFTRLTREKNENDDT